MSSSVAMFMALLLVSMHACHAKRAPHGFGIHKNVANWKTMVQHEVDIKSILASKDTKETLSGDTSLSMTTFDEVQSTFQIEGLGIKGRSMEESETHESKEPSNANDEEPVEDAVVMDYVTPHRKSPIHNQHHDVDRP